MKWRNFLYAFIGFIVPFIYSYLTSKFPDFPLSQDDLVAVVLWIVGMAVGGWNLKAASLNIKKRE